MHVLYDCVRVSSIHVWLHVLTIKLLLWLFVDMGQFDPTKGKQALEIRSSLSERRSLTDPIRPGDYSDAGEAHKLLWSKAHGNVSHFKILCHSFE